MPMQLPMLLAAVLPPTIYAGHPSSSFVSLVKFDFNCTDYEYSYGTRCTCTWTKICHANQCHYESLPCGHKDTPFCVGKDETAKCVTSSEVDSSNMQECSLNQMIERHCICGGVVCPSSVYKTKPTFSLDVLNICNTDLECVRNDYGSYTVFPYNGEITGADPEL